jgi:hypothetical protein
LWWIGDQEKEDKKHTKTQAEEQPTNPNFDKGDEGQMEELAGFEAVTYGRNCMRQQQQVIIGTSRDCEIKAEKKKHGYTAEECTRKPG